MQGNGSSSFWFMALLGCCVLLIGLMRSGEAALHHKVAGPRIAIGTVRLQEATPPLVRFIQQPVLTALGRQDHVITNPEHHAARHHGRRFFRYVSHSTYLWCVPYARRLSHVQLVGDAFLWWAEASGRYARGSHPEPGAVLTFHATAQMPLGHVAVVDRVISSREVFVDQANWVHNRISRNVRVVDISRNNNWTDVEVQTTAGSMGVPYPTYGFIYNQSPDGMMIANAKAGNAGSEVAEAPRLRRLTLSAPHRNLR